MTDINSLNTRFESLDAKRRLDISIEKFDKIAVASSFGLEDVAILDIIYRDIEKEIPVIFLDTLYHFEETLNLVDKFNEQYSLDLEVYRPPEPSKEEFEQKHGEKLWEKDIEKFHRLTKLRQIEKALKGKDAWITGIRRQQSDTRSDSGIIEWDEKYNLVKINPIVDWKRDKLEKYIDKNNVPYNSLHDQGYLSIGDKPLTEPVEQGQKERDGRWKGMDKTECGLHD